MIKHAVYVNLFALLQFSSPLRTLSEQFLLVSLLLFRSEEEKSAD